MAKYDPAGYSADDVDDFADPPTDPGFDPFAPEAFWLPERPWYRRKPAMAALVAIAIAVAAIIVAAVLLVALESPRSDRSPTGPSTTATTAPSISPMKMPNSMPPAVPGLDCALARDLRFSLMAASVDYMVCGADTPSRVSPLAST